MSEESILGSKINDLYKSLCQKEWNATMTGVAVALLSILVMAWWRPWGAVGAIRNWGDWIMYGLTNLIGTDVGIFGYYEEAPKGIFSDTGSVIGIGFVAGAFVSACLGNDFAFRVPPVLEMCKGVVAGVFMGIGSALAGGCNVGGFYNAIGNLSAHGFAMWLGIVIGVIIGLKYIYWEMENVTWGSGGATTIEFPKALKAILGVAALAALIAGTYIYAGKDDDYIASLGGLLIIAAGLGYSMQRGRWCMIQGFREPHMTGNCTMAKSVALSIFIVALGATVLKYGVPIRLDGDPVLDPINYVRATFGWGGVVGGIVFGLGAMLAGGCGTGTLWRIGEGQIKLWIAVVLFAISNSIMTAWFTDMEFEADGVLGKAVYLPDVFGYGGTLFLIGAFLVVWYITVEWNEESNKLIVGM
ncbi:MAG: YeeE/YedE family protein [Deltaproteobacteria bacterium]|nr:YeeE/YedE family protein [Deltaproteobacteria bacterium]